MTLTMNQVSGNIKEKKRTMNKDDVYSSLNDCYNAIGLASLSTDVKTALQKALKDSLPNFYEELPDHTLYLYSETVDSTTTYLYKIEATK